MFDPVSNADIISLDQVNQNFANWNLFFGHDTLTPDIQQTTILTQTQSPKSLRQTSEPIAIQQKVLDFDNMDVENEPPESQIVIPQYTATASAESFQNEQRTKQIQQPNACNHQNQLVFNPLSIQPHPYHYMQMMFYNQSFIDSTQQPLLPLATNIVQPLPLQQVQTNKVAKNFNDVLDTFNYVEKSTKPTKRKSAEKKNKVTEQSEKSEDDENDSESKEKIKKKRDNQSGPRGSYKKKPKKKRNHLLKNAKTKNNHKHTFVKISNCFLSCLLFMNILCRLLMNLSAKLEFHLKLDKINFFLEILLFL